MRKPVLIIVGLLLLLAGYAVGVVSLAHGPWLLICLAPAALGLGLMVFLVFSIGAMFLSDFFTRSKLAFLRRYGIQTQAVILAAQLYEGPGEHRGDPCFKGQYRFTDQGGHVHTFAFRGDCYDPYDLAYANISIHGYYQPGATRQLYYLRWLPFIYYVCGPFSGEPVHTQLVDSIALYFKNTARETIRTALDQLADKQNDAWLYPGASNAHLRIEEGEDLLPEYEDDEVDRVYQALGTLPASSIVIELHLSEGRAARESAIALAVALLTRFEGVVDDLHFRCWTLADLQEDVEKTRPKFLYWAESG